MLVGEQGPPFVGKSGIQLWADMERFTGLTKKDFYATNIIKEALPNFRDPKPAEVAAALPTFLDELTSVRPDVVVTAGGFATRTILGGVRLADVHGIPHSAEIAGHQFVCFPTYDPGAGLHNKSFLAAFAYDLGRLGAFLRGELSVWAPSSRPASSEWLLGPPVSAPGPHIVALDTEGWVENPWGLSFTPDGRTAYVAAPEVFPELAVWLRKQTLVLHNGIHDLPVLRAMGVNIERYHDTQVLAYHDLMRTGSGILEAESQNLGTLAYRECGLQLRELSDLPGVDFDTQTIPYTDAVRDYAGMDVIATWRLFDVYRKRGLVDYPPYRIDMAQVPLVETMIRNGIPFDVDASVDYYAETLDKIETCTEELQQAARRYGIRDFNPKSHPQVRDIVTRRIGLRSGKRTKGGKPSTSEKALAEHQDHPFVAKLQEHRALVKERGTYAGPLLEELL